MSESDYYAVLDTYTPVAAAIMVGSIEAISATRLERGKNSYRHDFDTEHT